MPAATGGGAAACIAHTGHAAWDDGAEREGSSLPSVAEGIQRDSPWAVQISIQPARPSRGSSIALSEGTSAASSVTHSASHAVLTVRLGVRIRLS